MIQNLINHVSLVVDKSGSMEGKPVVAVFDRELESLKRRSIELNQETRVSIYLFDNKVECLAFDMDVMRFKSLKGHYQLGGRTALIDAVLKSIDDNQKLPEMYGDHAFLQYVLTDGEENGSWQPSAVLSTKINALPFNWTMACLVPNAKGKFEAKKFGFLEDSIAIWDTTAQGLENAGREFTTAMDSYMLNRSKGIRSTSAFFKFDTSAITKSTLKTALQKLHPGTYNIFPVRKDQPIKEFVESWTGQPYRVRSAYYQPTKKVKVQDHKTILIQDVKTGHVYEGANMRQLLGLPDSTVEVDPGKHKDWLVLVQSSSVNRKLFQDTFVLVRNA